MEVRIRRLLEITPPVKLKSWRALPAKLIAARASIFRYYRSKAEGSILDSSYKFERGHFLRAQLRNFPMDVALLAVFMQLKRIIYC